MFQKCSKRKKDKFNKLRGETNITKAGCLANLPSSTYEFTMLCY
jgi:hypothetical protein